MKVISSWLIQNKEWLFSGVGVVILLAFINVFRNFINSKRSSHPKNQIQPKTRPELRKDINRLLEENRTIFEEYGPHHAESHIPLHDASIQWNRRVRNTIIPNNDKILFYLNEYKDLLRSDEAAIAQKFSVHAEAFKFNHISGDKNSSAPLFPKEILSILEDSDA